MSDDKRVDVEFGAKIGGLVAGSREAAAVVRQSTDQMKSHVAGLSSVVEGLKAPFLAITSLLAGGALFGAAIRDAADLGEHLQVLSQKTGVQASELSRLEYAAKLADTGVENLDAGLIKLARFMGEAAKGTGDAADTAARLGVSVKDATGKLRPMHDVLLELAEKFSGMKDGAAKSALAMEIFGKAGTSMIPMLNQGAAGINALEAEADRLGVTMSNEGAAAAADYGDAMDRLHGMMQGFARSLVLSVMPALTDTANAITSMREASGSASTSLNPLATSIRFVAAAGLEAYAAINALKEVMKGLWALMATPFSTHWISDIRKAGEEMEDNIIKVNEKVANALLKLRGFGGERAGLGMAGNKSGSGKGDAPDAPAKAKKVPDERLAAWKDELAQIKLVEDVGKDALLAKEVEFWQAKLRTVTGNGKADVKLRQQLNAEILGAAKQLHADELQSARVLAQGRRDAALEGIEIERRAVAEQRAQGELGAKEAEARLLALNARVLEIRLAALEEQRALAAGDLVKLAEIDNQIAAAKRASAREIVDINKDTTRSIANDWQNVFSHITNVLSTSVTAIINGTQSMRGALRGIFQNIALDFLASKAKELAHHAAIELAKRGITTATASHKVMTEAAAALKSLAITIATALKQVAIYAATAAAGAFAAIAAIPFVGPFLAPLAAGAALAGVLALGGRIASASGGYDIPAGVNPLTQLHAQEMVLPAPIANAVRGMVGGNGLAPTASGPAPAAPDAVSAATIGEAIAVAMTRVAPNQPSASRVEEHTYHIHAIDSRSLEETLRRNPAALASGVKTAVRSGHLGRAST